MNLFDCNCGYGPYMTRVFRSASTPAELLEEMDWCGIQTALAYHTAMRFDVPAVGNERLLEEIEGSPRLLPTWTLLPSQTGEQPQVSALIEGMRDNGVRALRLFPQDHRYFMDAATWGDQMAVYEERRIPLFIKDSLDKIDTLMSAFPHLVVITANQGINPMDRYAWPLADKYPYLYFDTSAYLVDGIIEEFCNRYGARRLLFGSGFPDHASGGALLTLAHANISEEERQDIGHGNLTRILSEVIL